MATRCLRAPCLSAADYDRGVTSATAETDITVGGPEGAETAPAGVRRVPDIVRRRLSTLDNWLDPYSWMVTGLVVAIAAILRLVGVSRPKGYIFDEVYYPTDAWDLLHHGVEWDEKTNGRWACTWPWSPSASPTSSRSS
jgi:dolichyl-phosphate-mannose-protein mannosyltransferase